MNFVQLRNNNVLFVSILIMKLGRFIANYETRSARHWAAVCSARFSEFRELLCFIDKRE